MYKNNIKIMAAMLFFSSVLNMCAMDSFRSLGTIVSDYVAQDASLSFIKDNFFLCATGAATVYCGMNLYKGYNKNRRAVYKRRDILAYPGQGDYIRIPEADERAIRERIKAIGIPDVEIAQGEFDDAYTAFEDTREIPVLSVQNAGKKACVFFNYTARKMLYGNDDERSQIYAVLEHEYDHIRLRQSEKDLFLNHFLLPLADFAVVAGMCKATRLSLGKMVASPQNALCSLTALGTLAFFGPIVNNFIRTAYSRSVERAADRAVLATKNKSMIRDLRNFCHMCQIKETTWARNNSIKNEECWYDKWFATHPSLQERIKTLETALQN